MANATLQQAAKEAGGLLTTERTLKIDELRDAMRAMHPEERWAAVAQMLDQTLKRKAINEHLDVNG